MRRIGLLLGILLVFASPFAMAAHGDVSDEDLARARETREKAAEERNTAAAAYTKALAALETTHQDIERTTQEVAATQDRFDGLKHTVALRAVAAYKGEHSGQFGAVLAAHNMNDFVDRAAYLERTAASDNAVIDRLRVAGIDLRDRKADLARLEGQQKEDAARAQRLQHELEAKLAEAVQQEDTLASQRAAEDEARRRAAAAEERRRASEDAARRARATGVTPIQVTVVGNFTCPVVGAVAYSDDFGDPRTGHTHQGNDLFATRGTPVVAVRSGSVSQDEGGAGGLMIFLSAGGDTFMYAHLDSFTVADGTYAAAGQQIGTVGSSGNVDADATHLHFEIHPGGGGAIDPYPTVSAYC